jgi:hypothetical protein
MSAYGLGCRDKAAEIKPIEPVWACPHRADPGMSTATKQLAAPIGRGPIPSSDEERRFFFDRDLDGYPRHLMAGLPAGRVRGRPPGPWQGHLLHKLRSCGMIAEVA